MTIQQQNQYSVQARRRLIHNQTLPVPLEWSEKTIIRYK
jgi:hypothetical protein